MLADELDFEENTVILALQALENLNMIVTDSGFFAIAGWQEYQNIDGMDKIREQNRIRQANFKQRQKLLNSNVIDNVTITEGNATEEDKDKEKEGNKEIYISIVSYLNEKAGTKYKATTDKTKKAIHARLSEGFTVEDFKTVIDKKCAEWIGDPKMEKYLRPETLFGTKFEGYLNAKTTGRNENNGQTTGNPGKVRVGHYL
jgi:uncharacterized phage protein (TIGR02220 family)